MTSRATSRKRRRTRLRATALPTLRLTVNPTRIAGRPRSAGMGAACSTKPGMAQRRPAWTRRKSRRFGRRPRRAAVNLTRPSKLSREPLAARPATAGDDLAATHRCHPGAEAVPALAHQLARLIGAFHYATPSNTIPPRRAAGAKSVGEGNKRAARLSQRKLVGLVLPDRGSPDPLMGSLGKEKDESVPANPGSAHVPHE